MKKVLNIKNKYFDDKRGFTLVETLVSLSLFVIIVAISIGSLLTIVNAERKSRDMRLVLDNFNVVFEDMIRTIRTGSDYSCGATAPIPPFTPPTPPFTPVNCPNGDSSIALVSEDGVPVVYEYNTATKEFKKTWDDGSGDITHTYFSTDPKLQVNNFTFVVNGEDGAGSDTQPYVVMFLDGDVVSNNISTAFHMQTTVTQRGLKEQ